VNITQTQLESGLAVMAVDFQNAFNTLARAKALGVVFRDKRLRPFHALLGWSYGVPSQLFVTDHDQILATVMSSEGVKLGDPLGGLLFSCGTLPVLKAAALSSTI